MIPGACRVGLRCALAVGLSTGIPCLSAQTVPSADPVKRGQALWTTRGCAGCHGIGKKTTGPDLAGVTQRRPRAWLLRFMKNTDQMLATDSTAMALLRQWKGVRMPRQTLTDQEVDALLAYIRSVESKLKR